MNEQGRAAKAERDEPVTKRSGIHELLLFEAWDLSFMIKHQPNESQNEWCIREAKCPLEEGKYDVTQTIFYVRDNFIESRAKNALLVSSLTEADIMRPTLTNLK